MSTEQAIIKEWKKFLINNKNHFVLTNLGFIEYEAFLLSSLKRVREEEKNIRDNREDEMEKAHRISRRHRGKEDMKLERIKKTKRRKYFLKLGYLIALWESVGWTEKDDYKRQRMRILMKEALDKIANVEIPKELSNYINQL